MQLIGMSFVVRTQVNAASVASAIRSTFSSADPEMAIAQPTTMEQIVEESVAARKFQTCLAVAFAVSALLLASLGIYGVISFTVARRTPEIGIRMALGAHGRQLLSMVRANTAATSPLRGARPPGSPRASNTRTQGERTPNKPKLWPY